VQSQKKIREQGIFQHGIKFESILQTQSQRKTQQMQSNTEHGLKSE
jgi:hypothetical protein